MLWYHCVVNCIVCCVCIICAVVGRTVISCVVSRIGAVGGVDDWLWGYGWVVQHNIPIHVLPVG